MPKNNLSYEELERYYSEHCRIVKTFAFFNPISSYGIEYDDYIQMLSVKLWDLVKKFDWTKYEEEDYSVLCRTFYSYVKVSFTHYIGEIIRQQKDPFNTKSLDDNIGNGEDSFCLLDLISDDKECLDEQYYLTKLRELKSTSAIKGFLLDRVEGMNYSQIAKKYKCSRGKVSRQIGKELDILKKIV